MSVSGCPLTDLSWTQRRQSYSGLDQDTVSPLWLTAVHISSHEVCYCHSAACYERGSTCRQWHKKVWPWPDSNLAWWPTLARCGRSSDVQTRCHHACPHGKAPQYLVDCCTPATGVVGRQRLRSATQQLMVAPRHRLTTVGRRAFAVHGPMVWNSLPDDLRAQQVYESFRQGLKTWLFFRY